MSNIEKFNKRWVANENGCHIWTGHIGSGGYGLFWDKTVSIGAHRWIFRYVHGYLPEVTMHKCDVRACVNIAHLQGGTAKENMRDMVAKGRHWTNRKESEFYKAKRKRDEDIVKQYLGGGVTQRELAKKYNVTQATIWGILKKAKTNEGK